MAKDNSTLTEPLTLTRCGLWRLHKSNLITWATGRCLLEHLDPDDVAGLSKDRIVDECMGAILRAEVTEEYRAAAHDTVARPVEELIG